MRFKPWMLAPKSKTTAGPWSALPPPALAALTSGDQSPMVQGYLINGSWPRATGTKPAAVATEPEQAPQTNQQPEPTPIDEASSLSLTIRVVQPMKEETRPVELPPKQSTWRRFLQAVQRSAA